MAAQCLLIIITCLLLEISNFQVSTRPFQDLKALLHAPLQKISSSISFSQHARPIHENGWWLSPNFHFVPAVLGSYHVYIRTVFLFLRDCDQFPNDMPWLHIVTFLLGGWLFTSIALGTLYIAASTVSCFFFCNIQKHHYIRKIISDCIVHRVDLWYLAFCLSVLQAHAFHVINRSNVDSMLIIPTDVWQAVISTTIQSSPNALGPPALLRTK